MSRVKTIVGTPEVERRGSLETTQMLLDRSREIERRARRHLRRVERLIAKLRGLPPPPKRHL